MMKSIIQRGYQGIDGLQVSEQPLPHRSPLGTLVKVAYVPVLPWDIKSEQGQLVEHPSQLPKVIGYGFAGTVQSSGKLGLPAGTRVVGATPFGSYAEVINAPIPQFVFPIPDEVPLADAATIFGGADTALMMLQKSQLQAGNRVLVIGASGGVGGYLVQLLSLAGIQVGILASPRSLTDTQQAFPGIKVVDQLSGFADQSFTAILDTSANSLLVSQSEYKLISGGKLFAAGLPTYRASRSDIQVIFSNQPISPKAYRHLIKQLANGQLKARVNRIFDIDETIAAQHFVDEMPARGRTLVRLSKD